MPGAYDIQAASPECSGIRDTFAAFRDAFAHSGSRRGAPDDEVTWT